MKRRIVASVLTALMVIGVAPIGASAEWRKDSTGWWYAEGNSWATGWRLINGNWHYFYSDGYMAHDTTIGGYYLNSDGAWTTSYGSSSTANAVSNRLYSEPATGDMVGWQKLRGHGYESVAEIYFKLDGSIQSVQVKDIRKVDLNKVVGWTDDNGIKRYNTVGEIYQLFKYSDTYTTDWFSNKFGSLYGEWLAVSYIDANNIVSNYLEMTGQISKKSNVTLTPDAEFTTIKEEEENVSNEEVIKRIEKYMKEQSKNQVSE